jgi:orotate phosphoribosyltransferase
LTAGTAIKETVEIIQQNNAKTVAAIVALDRMEIDANSLTFKENLEKSLSIPILSIAPFEDLKE